MYKDVLAGRMSRAPYLLDKARGGYRLGDGLLVDSMIKDGLWDAYDDLQMGTYGDRCADRYGFSREAQDDFAVASYERALAAAEVFAGEIVRWLWRWRWDDYSYPQHRRSEPMTASSRT